MNQTNSLVLASGNAGKIKELQALLPNYESKKQVLRLSKMRF